MKIWVYFTEYPSNQISGCRSTPKATSGDSLRGDIKGDLIGNLRGDLKDDLRDDLRGNFRDTLRGNHRSNLRGKFIANLRANHSDTNKATLWHFRASLVTLVAGSWILGHSFSQGNHLKGRPCTFTSML